MANAMIGADLTETYTADKLLEGKGFGLGDIYHDHSGKVYKFVKFDNGTGNVAAVAGNMAYYVAETGAETVTVTSDLSDGNGIGAGMFMSVPADGEFCWLQIKGPATLTTELTAGADGNALTAVGATDGTLDVSALVTDFICAVAIDASAKKVILDCPF